MTESQGHSHRDSGIDISLECPAGFHHPHQTTDYQEIENKKTNKDSSMARYSNKRNQRGQIVWIPYDGTQNVKLIQISPILGRFVVPLAILILVSVLTINIHINRLSEQIHYKDSVIHQLRAENERLQYLKTALVQMEKKEAVLKDYFGLGDFTVLEPSMVGGTKADLTKAGIQLKPKASHPLHTAHQDPSLFKLAQKIEKLSINYDTLNQLMIKQAEIKKMTPSIIPIDTDDHRITSHFGWRRNPITGKSEFHSGIDVVGAKGTKIIAPAGGRVIAKGFDQWLGNYVVLQHTAEIKTVYGHMEKSLVSVGKELQRGDAIGIMGNTGMSTSRHLHYTIMQEDRAVDPIQFILDANV
jgi:murein DD-endopeptidase MepM/ murein hydrolase activator NlpD